MGGIGSGTWSRYGSKRTIENQKNIDIRYLKRNGALESGTEGRIIWRGQGNKTNEIYFKAEEDSITLAYSIHVGDGPLVRVDETVPLVRTPCNYGGHRPWFLCPVCYKRVLLLYAAGEKFLCRHCYDLTYASQQEGMVDRLWRKARRVRGKFGCDYDLTKSFPPKPKGMHWRTYWRLRNREELANSKRVLLLSGIVEKFKASVGG